MALKVYSVHDAKAGCFNRPLFQRSDGEALRAFVDEAGRTGESLVAQHPEDFSLFRIGEFEELTGVLTPHPEPVHLANAKVLVDGLRARAGGDA